MPTPNRLFVETNSTHYLWYSWRTFKNSSSWARFSNDSNSEKDDCCDVMLTQYGRLLSLSRVLCAKIQSARGTLSLFSFRSLPTVLWRIPFSITIEQTLHELKGPDREDTTKDLTGRDDSVDAEREDESGSSAGTVSAQESDSFCGFR